MKPGQAAERLRLTVRQIARLVIRYRAEGPIGLISRQWKRVAAAAKRDAGHTLSTD
jgi:hypothetical protein